MFQSFPLSFKFSNITKPKDAANAKEAKHEVAEALLSLSSTIKDIPLPRGNYIEKSSIFRTYPNRDRRAFFHPPPRTTPFVLVLAGEVPLTFGFRVFFNNETSALIGQHVINRVAAAGRRVNIRLGLSDTYTLVIDRVEALFRFIDGTEHIIPFPAF